MQTTTKKTSLTVVILIISFLIADPAIAQPQTYTFKSFEKVIVSPHIAVTFRKGDTESVIVESISVPIEKLNVKVSNKTLKLYLDGAEITTKSKKENTDGENKKVSLYQGTVVRATVTYKDLRSLELRGDEKFVFESPIERDELNIKIYGESKVYMDKLILNELKAILYGESYLEIKGGKIDEQKITAYGESEINASKVDNHITRITAYGESSFRLNVSENLKITSYGESTIEYTGDAKLTKGIMIGENTITKM